MTLNDTTEMPRLITDSDNKHADTDECDYMHTRTDIDETNFSLALTSVTLSVYTPHKHICKSPENCIMKTYGAEYFIDNITVYTHLAVSSV